jgi:hypothetical protein
MASGVSLDSVQVDKANEGEAIKETLVERAEMVKQAGQDEGTTERSLHVEGRKKESPDVLSDAMQTETLDDSPKYSHVCVDGVAEASADTMEVDNTDEVRAQTIIPPDLRAQSLTGCVAKQSVEDGYVFQGSQGSKVEIPVGETRKWSCC